MIFFSLHQLENYLQTNVTAVGSVGAVRIIGRTEDVVVFLVPVEDVVGVEQHRKTVSEEVGTQATVDAIGGLVQGVEGLRGRIIVGGAHKLKLVPKFCPGVKAEVKLLNGSTKIIWMPISFIHQRHRADSCAE